MILIPIPELQIQNKDPINTAALDPTLSATLLCGAHWDNYNRLYCTLGRAENKNNDTVVKTVFNVDWSHLPDSGPLNKVRMKAATNPSDGAVVL